MGVVFFSKGVGGWVSARVLKVYAVARALRLSSFGNLD